MAGPAPRVVKIKRKRASRRRNVLGSKGEDFIPWVPAKTEGPHDLEEEERDERMTGLLDRYVASKRKRQVISSGESDTTLVQTAGPSQLAADGQPATNGSSGDQAIIIPCFPELGPTGEMEQGRAALSESNEDAPVPSAIQVILCPRNTHECQVTRHNSRKSGRVSLVRGALPKNHLSQSSTLEDMYMSKNGLLVPFYNTHHNTSTIHNSFKSYKFTLIQHILKF